jgi:hypothetical protein
MKVPILTYHAMNIAGNDYADNDHVALAEDLRTIHRLGLRIVPLARIVDVLLGAAPESTVERAVGLSFDDGSWFDWYDLEHPTCGMQRGFAGVLRDFCAATGAQAPATSFVIVSPEARATLDRTCLIGRDWWGDEWWPQALRENRIAIESHSWDHNHATLEHTAHSTPRRGTFTTIDDYANADAEIRQASEWLDARLPMRKTRLFAYPYGDSNDYLVCDYLPRRIHEHGLSAAFAGHPQPVERDSNRWLLPRYVCGLHWHAPGELEALLRDAAT